MKHETVTQITAAVSSHKGAATVAGATVTSGLANWFDLISNGLGLFAAVCGITLTLILIRKHALEYKMLKSQADATYGRREEDQNSPP